MLKRATIDDYVRVREIMNDISTYPYGGDDGCPEEYDPITILSDGRIYVLMPDDNSIAMFVPINHINYEEHVCALPESRDRTNRIWLDAWEYMFTRTVCEKITVKIPEFNQLAYAKAKKIGFIHEGLSVKSIKRNGKLYDQVLMGITKEEWECLS